jgi:tRNA U34 5-carboxymethylaminomethyl modifying GTPase MnmE/TrmE
MNVNTKDTIVALATAHGSSAIAVIRLCGEQAINIFIRKKQTKQNHCNRLNHTLLCLVFTFITTLLLTKC